MAKFVLRPRRAADIVIIDVEGNTRFGDASFMLRNTFKRLLLENNSKFLLNFSSKALLYSTFVGDLACLLRDVSNQGCQLHIHFNDAFLRRYDVAEFTRIVCLFGDNWTYGYEKEALVHFE